MNFGHPAVNRVHFPLRQASQPVSYDDYFPHNQNKNDLGKPRSFLVRVERVELWILVIKKTLNRANLGSVEPRRRVATVIRDLLISSTLSSSWATGGQHQLGRGLGRLSSRNHFGHRFPFPMLQLTQLRRDCNGGKYRVDSPESRDSFLELLRFNSLDGFVKALWQVGVFANLTEYFHPQCIRSLNCL
jgi:hypothetical protein